MLARGVMHWQRRALGARGGAGEGIETMNDRIYNPDQDELNAQAAWLKSWAAQDAVRRAARRKHPPHITDRMLFGAAGTLWLALICWGVWL